MRYKTLNASSKTICGCKNTGEHYAISKAEAIRCQIAYAV